MCSSSRIKPSIEVEMETTCIGNYYDVVREGGESTSGRDSERTLSVHMDRTIFLYLPKIRYRYRNILPHRKFVFCIYKFH